MPREYEIYVPDVKKVRFKRNLPTPEEIAKHMEKIGILSPAELKALEEQIRKHLEEAESSWIIKLVSSAWYFMRAQIVLSPEKLYWIMSNFDQLKDLMPNEFWKNIIMIIDKIGEELLKKEK